MPKGIPKNGINKGWIKKGSKLSKEIRLKMSVYQKTHQNNGRFRKDNILSDKTKQKISLSLLKNKRALGKKHPNSKGHKQTEETRLKISKNLSIAKTGVPQFHMRGEKNNHWKGGITPMNLKIRQSFEIKLWRRTCFERDNYLCQRCKIGGKLQVHHINNFADFPLLRTSIENGITLCKKDHFLFHKIYGKRNNTKKQLLKFITDKNI